MINLLPNVEKVKMFTGTIALSNPIKYFFCEKKVNVFILFDKNTTEVKDESSAEIIFRENRELSLEAYSITVNEKVYIEYGGSAGAFYAVQTLKKYMNDYTVPRMEIFDKPKISIRGFMLDISRNKVQKVTEIKKLIDLMAERKEELADKISDFSLLNIKASKNTYKKMDLLH